jgi:glycosyltransferase involved in cell wall biosynthesis
MIIGLVTTSFPRQAGDYAGSFIGDRARCLLAQGHDVHVLAAGDGHPTREIVHERLTVTRLGAGHALFYGAGAPEVLERGGGAAWFEAVRFSVALAAAVRAHAPRVDLLESHWLVPSTLAALAGAPGGRHRAYAHSGDVALLERIPFGRAIARRFVDAGVGLRFVSDDLRSRFAALAGAPGPVGAVAPLVPFVGEWPPRAGVDIVGRRRLGLAGPTILAVGRLVPIKGHDRLLRACARVQSAGKAETLEVVILGDGPERARLGRLADELGVQLRLPGFVPRSEVARWLRASDVFVQPSISLPNGRSEGAPFATAEARAVGIPVLVESDVGRLAAGLSRRLQGSAAGV